MLVCAKWLNACAFYEAKSRVFILKSRFLSLYCTQRAKIRLKRTSRLCSYIICKVVKEISPKNAFLIELKLGRRGEKIPARQNVLVSLTQIVCGGGKKVKKSWSFWQSLVTYLGRIKHFLISYWIKISRKEVEWAKKIRSKSKNDRNLDVLKWQVLLYTATIFTI